MIGFAMETPGDQPAVVMLHGYCQSSAYWAPTARLLAAAGRRMFAPDLPGFGASSNVDGPYTMSALADALARALDARGLERVVLVGGSMGGVVAQHVVARHAPRVARLLLVATGARTGDPAAALAKADAIAAAPWNESAVAPIVDGFFLRPPAPQALAEFRRIAMAASHRAAIDAARSNAINDTFDVLPSIGVPTLIVQGRYDKARTPEHGAMMQAQIANAALAVIDDAGHTPQLEQPDAFHRIALPFLLDA